MSSPDSLSNVCVLSVADGLVNGGLAFRPGHLGRHASAQSLFCGLPLDFECTQDFHETAVVDGLQESRGSPLGRAFTLRLRCRTVEYANYFLALRFRATASRMRSCRAGALIFSPSWMSMARLTLPPRLELKSPDGSSKAAPLKNVNLTTFL